MVKLIRGGRVLRRMSVDLPETLYDATIAAGIPRTRVVIAALETAVKEAEKKNTGNPGLCRAQDCQA